ncbi:MAG: LON peptidase substrate-binding domain-containing protein [Alphaproteobacteria bacterium]|nr:LON peptidase substrate-binding domain-containing protein [Alphaproteobacteria bacterium]
MTSFVLPAKTHPSALPAQLPVLPILGSVLLPNARLPMILSEPRYLALVEDALGKGRLIGMLQPSVNEEMDNPPLYSVGCAGRITSFSETDDGRMQIVLTGLCRFRVTGEKPRMRLFRTVDVDWQPYLTDLGENDPSDIDRDRLLELMQIYFRKNAISVDWKVVKNAPSDVLLPTIVMICPLAPNEKQALLEAESFAARAKMLVTLLEMAAMPQAGDDGEVRH